MDEAAAGGRLSRDLQQKVAQAEAAKMRADAVRAAIEDEEVEQLGSCYHGKPRA